MNEVDRRRLTINPLRLLDSKEEAIQPLLDAAPHSADYLCDECASHLATLRGYLDAQGMPHTINFRLVRGLDYYTKTVFEVWAEGIGAQAAVCGGGRYDGLIEELGGAPTPGIGFAMGIERIIMALRQQGIVPPALSAPRVQVSPLGQAARLHCAPADDRAARARDSRLDDLRWAQPEIPTQERGQGGRRIYADPG